MNFLSIFKMGPSEEIQQAIDACDTFFNNLPGVQGDEIIAVDYGQIEFVLWGSEKARDDEYRRRHDSACPGYSVCWVVASGSFESSRTEMWAPFKRLKNGGEVIHPWVLQHETHHAIDHALRLKGDPDAMSDPDHLVNKKFYR